MNRTKGGRLLAFRLLSVSYTHLVTKGAETNLEDLIVANKDYVVSVAVDDSKVDYNQAGEYKAIFTITFDGEKLRDFLSEHNCEVLFRTEGETIKIKVAVPVTVVDEGIAKQAEDEGDEAPTGEMCIRDRPSWCSQCG